MKLKKYKKIYLQKLVRCVLVLVLFVSSFASALPTEAATRTATYFYNAFQFYNDDGSTINNATAYDSLAENANATGVAPSSTIRLRAGIRQQYGPPDPNANLQFTPQLQFKAGAASCTDASGWTTVPTQSSCGSNAICQWTSANFADGALTTQRLTGTFLSGGDGIETNGTPNQVSYTTTNQQAEWEWMLAVTPNAATSTTYTVRVVYSGGTALNGYNVCSTLTTWDYPPEPPTLSISEPDGTADTVTQGDIYNITYTLADPDSVVTAAFYYDTNNSGLDGTAISGACATAAEGTDVTCAWNTIGVTPGSYYIYGITDDGDFSPVSAYSPGQITILEIFPTVEQSAYRWFENTDTFGTGGVLTGASASYQANGIANDSTYMYAVGRDDTPDWRIEKRLLSTGALDTNFGTAGVVTGDSDSGNANAIAIDSTYMYVVGSFDTSIWRIEKRLLSTGALDTNFGTAGVVTGVAQNAMAIVIDSTYMYVAGYINAIDFGIEKRLLSTGELDLNFGTNGRLTGDSTSSAAYDIAIDSTYLYIVGYGATADWHIEKRLLSTGAVDSNFGTNGIVVSDTASNIASAIVIDSTYMYIVGNNSSLNWRIEKRLLSNGNLDSNFGTSGVVSGVFASQFARSITIDSTYMYVAGSDDNNDFRIEKRTLLDGSLATSAVVGRPLAPQDTLATLAHASSTFRLRMNLHVTVESISPGDHSFKLQYAAKGAAATCGAVADGSFGDVSTSAGAIRYYDNTGIDNAVRLIASPNDPLHIDHTVVNQTYQEQNDFTATSTINIGQDGKWDFALVDYAAARGTTYCFRATSTDVIVNYASSTFPEITTGPTLTQAGYRWLEDNQGKVFGDNETGIITGASVSNYASEIAIDSTYMYIAGGDDNNYFRIEKRLLSTGALDANFGTSGVVTGDSASYHASAIVIDSTYMYVAGNNTSNYWRIEKRLLSTGALDANFGTSGVLTISDGGYSKISIDSKYIYITGRNIATDVWRTEKRLLSDGSLVSGFGISGVVLSDAASYLGTNAISIDSTYMYLGGRDDSGNLRLEKRLLSTGVVDSGFGTSGIVTSVGGFSWFTNIALDSTFLYAVARINNDWRIEKRLLSTGALDSNFGTSGVVTGASASNFVGAISLDSTYMYVVGSDDNNDWRIEKRLLSTGALDSNFGTSGVVTGASASNSANDIVIDSTYMYVVGSTDTPDWRIEKRTLHSGSLNTYSAFTDEGLSSSNSPTTLKEQGQTFRLRMLINATSTTSTVDTLSFKLQIAPKGVASTCANVSTSTYSDVSMTTGTIRFYDNPTLYDNYQLVTSSTDPTYQAVGNFAQSYKEQNPFRNTHSAISFGGNGIWDFALYDHSMPRETTYCFRAIHEDGYELNTYSYYPEITSYTPYLTQSGYRVFREDVDGVDFGTGGVVTSNNGYTIEAIAKDTTYMYVTGSNDNSDWRIEKRLLSTGAVDSNFGTSGVVTGDGASHTANAIAIDSTYMYLAGYDSTLDWRIEKRLLSTGDLVSNFGASGVVTGGSSSTYAYALAIDSNYMYVVGFEGLNPYDWRIEKRLLSTGDVDTNFGNAGIVTGSSTAQYAKSIALDSTFMYVVGSDDNGDWRIEKRYLSDGSLHTSFGTAGVVTGASTSTIANSIALDSTYMYVVGHGNNDWRIEKRHLSDGSLNTSFGTSGVVTGDSTSYIARAIAIDATYMYVTGFDDNHDLRIEKRLLSTGAVDTNFGTTGVVTGASLTGIFAAKVIDSTYMYVGGVDDNSDWRIEKRLLSTGATSTQNIVPGAPLAAQNSVATLTNTTQHFHLRTLVSVTSSTLPLSDQDFKLQVALKGVAATCADVSSGSYADVATSTGDIRYHDNTNFTHNTVLGTTSTDPYITSVTSTINQTYLEQNNFTNANAAVTYGYHAMWDFSLADVTAPDSTTYCFRIVKSDNSLLESYTQFPEVTTVVTGANVPPTITSFSDAPDPVTVGNAVTFTVDWDDVDGDDTRTFVCKSDSFTTSTLTCPGGWWASSTAFAATNPVQVSYTTQVGDAGSRDYYAFVCDVSNNCSDGTFGTFLVTLTDTVSGFIEGVFNVMGDVIFR